MVGIVIRAEEGLSYFEIVDLGKKIDKINKRLREKFYDEIEIVKEIKLKDEKKEQRKQNSFLIFIIILLAIGSVWYYKYSQNEQKAYSQNSSILPVESTRETENLTKINLKGRVIDFNTKQGIDGFYVYIEDDYKKSDTTHDNGLFLIKDVENKKLIKLCYEHKIYTKKTDCMRYQGDENVSFEKL